MNTAPQYATRRVTVPAGGTVEIVRTATFVTVLAADAPFRARFDNYPEFDLEQGLTLRTPNGFQRIELRNPSAGPINVTIGLGRGDVNDARLVISGQVETQEQMPELFTTGAPVSAADAACTQVAGANVKRRELIIVAPTSAASAVYVGGSASAAAGEGLPVQPGQSLTLSTTAAVYVRNDTGAAVAVSVAQVERS